MRFHGAFHGGFNAGYFNTVGSEKGWTPSAFVSSRSQRADASELKNRPEDYMDQEDLREFVSAGDNLVASKAFQSALPSGGLSVDTVVVPQTESVGVKLLRTMGWREGFGVGPRKKARAQSLEATPQPQPQQAEAPPAKRAPGCALPPSFAAAQSSSAPMQTDENENTDPAFAPAGATFAPKNTRCVICRAAAPEMTHCAQHVHP